MVTREIKSLQHPIVKHLLKLRENRAYREENQTAVIHGKILVQEIPKIKTLLIEKGHPIPKNLDFEVCYLVDEAILKKVSGVVTPEIMVAEVELPKPGDFSNAKALLALDQIRDPGNLGTLLRTALALGFEGAYLLDGTVDPFNDKVIRASKGASFKLPLMQGSFQKLSSLIEKLSLTPYVADLEGKSIENATFSPPLLLILGNESHGPSEESKKISTSVTIPISQKIESLNVAIAGSILMYQIKSSLCLK